MPTAQDGQIPPLLVGGCKGRYAIQHTASAVPKMLAGSIQSVTQSMWLLLLLLWQQLMCLWWPMWSRHSGSELLRNGQLRRLQQLLLHWCLCCWLLPI